MPTYTFTPGTVVPPTAIYGTSPNLNDDSLGTDDTPVGWPTTGKITAVEWELTSTTVADSDAGVWVGVSKPGAREQYVGATSQAGGVFTGDSGDVTTFAGEPWDLYALDKFGGWRTDYLTFGTGISTNNLVSTSTTASFGPDLDISFEVRRADWSASANNCIWFAASTNSGGYIRCTGTGIEFRSANNAYGATATWAQLGVVNGQWFTGRITWTNTDRLKFYAGNTVVHTATLTGYTRAADATATMRFGNGLNSQRIGFDGDIRYVNVSTGSGVFQTTSFDAMDSSTDLSWTPAVGVTITKGSAVTASGSTVAATVRVRLDLDAPVAPADLRVVVYRVSGEYTVDEILLEVQRGRRGLGLIRG